MCLLFSGSPFSLYTIISPSFSKLGKGVWGGGVWSAWEASDMVTCLGPPIIFLITLMYLVHVRDS